MNVHAKTDKETTLTTQRLMFFICVADATTMCVVDAMSGVLPGDVEAASRPVSSVMAPAVHPYTNFPGRQEYCVVAREGGAMEIRIV